MDRQEAYQEAIKLHKQGLGSRRIHKIISQIPLSTIEYWVYLGQRPWPEPNLKPSPALSYILGVLYGDGYTYVNKRNSHVIGLKAKDKEFVNAFCEAMNKINLSPYIDFQQEKYYRATISSKKFFDWFRKINLEKIESLIGGHEIDFIRGFFDSEGYLQLRSKNNFTLSIGNTNLEILRLVGKLLFKFGFQINIYKINMLTMLKCRKQYYRLWLLGGTPEVIRFLKLIQPSIPRKTMEAQ